MTEKAILKFDVFPDEKTEFGALCKELKVTKIEFLRRSIKLAQKKPELFNVAEEQAPKPSS